MVLRFRISGEEDGTMPETSCNGVDCASPEEFAGIPIEALVSIDQVTELPLLRFSKKIDSPVILHRFSMSMGTGLFFKSVDWTRLRLDSE
jgi:hypothetical protein